MGLILSKICGCGSTSCINRSPIVTPTPISDLTNASSDVPDLIEELYT